MGIGAEKRAKIRNKLLKIFLIIMGIAIAFAVVFALYYGIKEDNNSYEYTLRIEMKNGSVVRIKDVEKLYASTKLEFTTESQEAEINKGEFIKIDLKGQNSDPNLLYEHFLDWFSILESSHKANLYLRNQGFYINVKDESILVFYVTQDSIYTNKNVFNNYNLKSKYLMTTCLEFIECLLSSEYYFTVDTIEEFVYDLCDADRAVETIILPLIFRSVKADIYE